MLTLNRVVMLERHTKTVQWKSTIVTNDGFFFLYIYYAYIILYNIIIYIEHKQLFTKEFIILRETDLFKYSV